MIRKNQGLLKKSNLHANLITNPVKSRPVKLGITNLALIL